MKRRAIIYTRVSTDEQNNGYSPSDQKDKLHKYCENNGFEIVGFYHDDESGKSFNRPQWLNIMQFIKKNSGYVDNILFLKWDRFSRNVAEAYITIRDLKKMGVEPQSIEQPLDFEIPESKIMLAIYLAAPEVDNDRRALNIFHGIRRGKKEGRWLGACLRGYKNTRDENNRPIIAPEGGTQEKLVRLAFKEFAEGMHNIEELRKKLYKQGRFFYYHCSGGCKERQKAFEMNTSFIDHLKEYNNSPKYMELFATILKGNLKNYNSSGKKEADKITANIAKLNMRLKNAKDMMLDGEFSSSDYKEMKVEIEAELEKLNRDEMQIRQGMENYDTKIDDCLDIVLNLDKYYDTKSTEVKQKIVGSVFPEKLYFEENEYRTTKLNEAVEILCKTDKGLGQKKGGKKTELSVSSLRVVPPGFEPGTT